MELKELITSMLSIESISDNEKEVLLFIEEYLSKNNVEFTRIPVSKDRWNIFAKKGNKGPGILLSGHCDTVPINEPKKAYIKDNKIYGVGASDMKAALAICLYNFVNTEIENLVGLLVTVGEEKGNFDGIKAFVKKKNLCKDFKYCIIGEPSDLKLYTQQFGAAVLEINVKGIQRHTMNTKESIHPVNQAVECLNKLRTDFEKQFPESIFAINKIHAGHKFNIVPEEIEIAVDVRVHPKNTLSQIDKLLEKHKNIDIKKKVWLEPTKQDTNELFDYIKQITGNTHFKTMKSFTEMHYLVPLGISTIIIGPGLPEQAHTQGEYIPLENIKKYSELNRGIMQR